MQLFSHTTRLNRGHPHAKGLVGMWKVLPQYRGGTIFRNLAMRYDLALTNSPTWSDGRDGLGSLAFGATAYGYAPSRTWQATFTLMAWTRHNDGTAEYERIFETDFGTHWYLGTFSASDDKYKLIVNNSVFPYGSCEWGPIDTDWHHLAATYDGTTGSLYVDGDLKDTGTFTSPGSFSDDLYISAYNAAPATYGWDGHLDDIRIYDGCVLSADMIADIWEDSLTGRYDMLRRVGRRVYSFPGAGGAYTIDLEVGSYSITGNSAALTVQRKLDMNTGIYAATGNDVTLTASRQLPLDAGEYDVSGHNPTMAVQRQLSLDAGAYAATGHDPAITVGRAIGLEAGSYAASGHATSLTVQRQLSLDTGVYVANGHDPTLTVSRVLSLDAGAYSVTGYSVELTYSGGSPQAEEIFRSPVMDSFIFGD